MRAIGHIAVVITALLALGGCAASTSETISTPVEPQTTESSPSPSPSVSPTESESTQSRVVPEPCSLEVELAMQETINAQTKAFSEEEFEIAYSFASPSFQAAVTLRSFVGIIAGSYGPLISSSALSFSDCLMDPEGTFGIIDVSFVQSGENVYALRYLMVSTTEGWRVEGASNLEVVGKGA